MMTHLQSCVGMRGMKEKNIVCVRVSLFRILLGEQFNSVSTILLQIATLSRCFLNKCRSPQTYEIPREIERLRGSYEV